MISALYSLVIYPIEIFLEIFFSIIYDVHPSACLAIIGVSLVVNFLLLPLYDRADRISQSERRRQEAMSFWVKHIRETFKGDERFMMLQAYYRHEGYHPLQSLRSSVSLMLQIPFFIAAYHFLSNLRLLDGYSFHMIGDLSQPDALISLMGAHINLLPFLMTFINIISIMLYTKGAGIREKLQLYGMAIIFLVILYDSPSGLVIYWLMNNIFSLMKNIVHGHRKEGSTDVDSDEIRDRKTDHIFFLGVVLLAILIGLMIPLSVVVSSPEEFVTLTVYKDPLHYVLSSFLVAVGAFVLWFSVFYYLMRIRSRRVFAAAIWLICGLSLTDFLIFGNKNLTLSPELVYRGEFGFDTSEIVLNILVLAALSVIMILIWKCRRRAVLSIYHVLIAGIMVLSIVNLSRTELQLKEMDYLKSNSAYKEFTLSKHGKNVIVIMLDCAKGPYLPFLIEERPELKEMFSGFTYYPNTLSHGEHTIIGAPGLFGGYGYTPEGMNDRTTEKLVDKHNEALTLMPLLFSSNGYEITVYDPPLAGYNDISDLSIYDPYPEIHAYSLKNRFISGEALSYTENYRKRQFFMYGIFKATPLFAQAFIYRGGSYRYPDTFNVDALLYVNSEFADSFSILDNLSEITMIDEGDKDCFMMMDNDATHDPTELQLPGYEMSGVVDNTGLESLTREDGEGNVLNMPYPDYYHVNMASLLKIGEWLEYLKMNEVYDNTRIVIVSDHGSAQGEFEDLILEDGRDTEGFCPLLMFKDFGQEGFHTDECFMTNADTPELAMSGLIDEPVNPFTGEKIQYKENASREQLVFADNFTDTEAYVFEKTGQDWYYVKDDVRIRDNWKRAE